jgi:hypothetical protein
MKRRKGFGLLALLVVLYVIFGGERPRDVASVQVPAAPSAAPSIALASVPVAAPPASEQPIARHTRLASIEPVAPTRITPREAERAAKAKEKPQDAQPPKPSVGPALATAAIVKFLIAQSIASYSGSCACPYSTDRGGRACGGRSAHSRRGGAAPLCFASDVTLAMVTAYRERAAFTQ